MGGFFQYKDWGRVIFKNTTLNFIYVVQFFLLYKMTKRKLKKSSDLIRKMAHITPKIGVFRWFLMIFQKKSNIFCDFHAHETLYGKINMLFIISVKNYIVSYVIQKFFFSVKNWPVADQGGKFWKMELWGTTG
jgi:hypothetical protein